jgi:aspartyl-tRNA synthetase
MSTPGPEAVRETTSMRDRLCGTLTSADIGSTVELCGWVAKRREHGEHLAFIDLRDYSGIVQCVVDGNHDLRSEYVVRVVGTVHARPEGTVNDKIPTGEVEVRNCTIEVLSAAEPPPFGLEDRSDVDEQIRLRYRFLDLRRPRLQRNLRVRAAVNRAIRHAMDAQGFVEIDTPILWAPTPEGAREFAVPSRLHHGKFYVLPQSPQLAKQLLMVGGFDRYYQIARCMRDEDLRADRQFEFTQLDLEASFATQDDIMNFVSRAVLDAAEAATGERPDEIVTMTWRESMDRFGTDKPDLRIEGQLVDLSSVFEGSEVRAFSAPVVKALRVPDGAATTRSQLDALTDKAKALGAKGLAWFKVVEEAGSLSFDSPLDRFLSDDERAAMLAATGVVAGDLVLCVADEWRVSSEVLGTLRSQLLGLPVGEGPARYVWITEFPLFDGLDDAGKPISAHHPFTMPHQDDLEKLLSDPLSVRSQSYDLVLNGWELGSGSVRIHRADIQSQIFEALGLTPEEAESRFGFLLSAFRYGAPPHAGFAFGIDRLVAIFVGEDNIREVIAFPKTQSGTDLMTGAPSTLTPTAVRDLGLKFTAPEQ